MRSRLSFRCDKAWDAVRAKGALHWGALRVSVVGARRAPVARA